MPAAPSHTSAAIPTATTAVPFPPPSPPRLASPPPWPWPPPPSPQDTLTANRVLIEELTEMLIEQETVDYNELQALVSKNYPERLPEEAYAGGQVPQPLVAA